VLAQTSHELLTCLSIDGMAKYSKEACDELMKTVSMSLTVIQSTSAQLIFWKRHALEIVQSWDQEFRAADMEKRLILMYLANDVVQTSKLQGRHFVEAFHPLLQEAFKHMVKHSDSGAQKKLKHLVKVWRERNVWGTKVQAKYEELVRGIEGSDAEPSAHKPPEKQPKPGDPYTVLQVKQHEIVKLSQKAQALMAAADHAHKALEDAAKQVRAMIAHAAALDVHGRSSRTRSGRPVHNAVVQHCTYAIA
jgi:CID domain